MCGRFTREYTWREVHEFLDLRWPEPRLEGAPEIEPSWNVAPTQDTLVARVAPEGERRGERELAPMRWGLVPFWAKDVSIGSKMINARADGIASKPAFRAAFKRRRCVVPISGFYEWRPTGEKKGGKPVKQPHYIFPAEGPGEGRLLALAGLWEQWDQGDGPLETFTIITTEPNAMMAELHDRMPVILDRAGVGAWLDGETEGERLHGLLAPAPEGTLDRRAVSTRVNSPRNDGPELCVEQTPDLLF